MSFAVNIHKIWHSFSRAKHASVSDSEHNTQSDTFYDTVMLFLDVFVS